MSWIIVPTERLEELDAINAEFTDRQCTANPDKDGVFLTGADKLSDPYWSAYHEFLKTLEVFEGEPEWPLEDE